MKFPIKKIQELYPLVKDTVRNFLKSPQSREFLLFLFFVVIALTFWTLHTLNDNYETEVSIPLKMKNIPENVVMTNEIPSHLNLRIEDRGTVLVNYLFGQGFVPLTLDFNDYQQKGSHIRILSSNLEKKILSQLSTSTKLKEITPDTLELIYTEGIWKKIPVQIQGDVTAEKQYYIAGKSITPDSVTAYAPQRILDTIKVAYTEKLRLTSVIDTIHHTAQIKAIKGVKFIPSQVNIDFYADILTEKTVSVPIRGVNFPSNKTLKTFPTKANITFQVGRHQFKQINAEDFAIEISYNELEELKSDRIPLRITRKPAVINHARITPKDVEYLIEDINF